MQRVVVLFVGILSVVGATPFDPDSVDRPTPFRYTFTFKEVENGNDAFSEDSGHKDGYKIGTFESGEDSNLIDEADEGRSSKALDALFANVNFCEELNHDNIPKEGCIYVSNGNFHLLHALSVVDIEDVYKALDEAGLEKCKVREDGSTDIPKYGCFWIDEDNDSLHLMGVYSRNNDDGINDIADLMETLEKCEDTGNSIIVPEGGCVWFGDHRIHLIHVLTEDNIDSVMTALGKLDFGECVVDEDQAMGPCYKIDEESGSIYFVNLPGGPEGVHEDDDDYEYVYSEKPHEIPSLTLPIATGIGRLQQLKLKGFFNEEYLVSNKAKAVLPRGYNPKNPKESKRNFYAETVLSG